MFPFLKTLFADSGYQGPKFAKALAKVLPHLDVEIIKRSDRVSGFVVLPKRRRSAPTAERAGTGYRQSGRRSTTMPSLKPATASTFGTGRTASAD
jgi:transposase